MTKSVKKIGGFTLLEILLVVGIISILAGIVILAINPTKQLGDTRNAQRRSDVLTILNAIYQFSIDNNGNLDTIADGSAIFAGACSALATDAIDLETDLVGTDSTYLVSIPQDPTDGTGTFSKYFVSQDATSGRITVCAPSTEGSIADISVTR